MQRLQGSVTKLGYHGHVSSITPVSDLYPVTARKLLDSIKCIPLAPNVNFKPGMQVHFLQLVQIADRHTRRDAQAPA